MKKRQIMVKDIAKALYISPSAVSRSLADHPGISQETRSTVNAYAREHEYKPNALALSLRTNNMETIGVILSQIIHYLFSSALSGIEGETEKGGYRVIICRGNKSCEKEVKGTQALLEAHICGVLVSVARTTMIYNHSQELIDSDIPMVFFDRICMGILTDRMIADGYAGVRSAVEYSIRGSCRRVAFFGSPSHLAISDNCRMGYEDALRKNGLPVDKKLIKICDSYTEALRSTPELLSLPDHPDTFFAVNDETAIGVPNIIKAKGLRISDGVSICGFTNNSLAEVSDSLLTSVDQHGYELGAIAIRLLIERLNGVHDRDRVVSKTIKTNLVVGQSTC